jgi:predicted PurR-regulated permease PerM
LAFAAALVLVWVAKPIAVGLLLGALVAFSLQPFFDRLLRLRLSPALAAAICAAASVISIGAVILGLGFLLVSRGLAVIRSLPEAVAPGGGLHPLALEVSKLFGRLHLVAADDPLAKLREGAGALAYHTSAGMAAALVSALLALLFLGLATYYVLLHWPDIVTRAEHDLPFNPLHTRALFGEFHNVGRQVLFGTVSAGLVQGLLAALGYWMTGVPEAPFLGALTAVVSLVPGIGATLVWLPIGLFRIFTGHPASGAAEIVYGAVVVGVVVDYVIRPRLVGRDHIPALFTFIGLFGGVAVFGLIGLILGPMLVSLCLAILKIYDEEVASEVAVSSSKATALP